ncbi:MAG: hypothetical protein V4618_21295 [Pseudomonadota bacterium]
MREPSPRTSRLAIAGGLIAAIALVGAGFVAGRGSAPAAQAPAPRPAPATVRPPDPAPDAPAMLDRAALLDIAAQAADDVAANAPLRPAVAAAGGRRFDLVLPFGCAAAEALESPGAMRWSFDPKTTTLRIAVDPILWRGSEWTGEDSADGGPGLRGFWIARPWSTATTCVARRTPGPDPQAAPLDPPAPTLAIARLVEGGEVGKVRGYEVVQRLAATDFDPAQGFRLRITGRLSSVDEGGPVRCLQPDGAERRPVCVITATFSEIRIENPKNSAVLGSWPITDAARASDGAGGAGSAAAPR